MTKKHWTIAGIVAALAAAGIAGFGEPQISQVISPNPQTAPTPTVSTVGKSGPGYIYPLVPGAIDQETSNQDPQAGISMWNTICNAGNWSTKSIRPPVSYTNGIKVDALATYNQTWGTNYTMGDGELDHLISIELGGSPTSTDNLWFEPYTTQVNGVQIVGAHEKDKVENLLHSEACGGEITLQRAQQIITTDWYACYVQRIENDGSDCL